MDGLFAPCSTLRLSFPTLLMDHERIIYLDTDVLVFRDIRQLWGVFRSFNQTTIWAAAPDSTRIGRSYAARFARLFKDRDIDPNQLPHTNTGVLLMDLAKLRTAKAMEWFKEMKNFGSALAGYSDQVIQYNAYIYTLYKDSRPSYFLPLL
jgi:lipopolysaccharide biosynthesis glycosyltransferase